MLKGFYSLGISEHHSLFDNKLISVQSRRPYKGTLFDIIDVSQGKDFVNSICRILLMVASLSYALFYLGSIEQSISLDIDGEESIDAIQINMSNVVAIHKAPGGFTIHGYELNKSRYYLY